MAISAADLAARLDRLPRSRRVWRLILLISLGACFELYDLFLTAYIVPGMTAQGRFSDASPGPSNPLNAESNSNRPL